MPDMTVTWPGAVPFDAAYGQQNGSGGGSEVQFDAAAMAGKFVIRPAYSHTQVSVYEGAVPYVGVDDFDEVLDQYAEVADEVVVPKKRVKKAV
jgi:hypothetical protein